LEECAKEVARSRDKGEELRGGLREIMELADRRKEFFEQEERDRSRLEQIRDKSARLEKQSKECAANVMQIQQRSSKCRADIAMCDARMPELEELKRAAVAAKGFKDAARLTQEIKDLAVRRDALFEAKAGHDADVVSSRSELERIASQLTTLGESVRSLERDSAEAKLRILGEHMNANTYIHT
jgi:chromosome segregation ATPase